MKRKIKDGKSVKKYYSYKENHRVAGGVKHQQVPQAAQAG
jgi:hypothetical protein